MSEKRIVGVDIGSYAIKVVYLAPKGEVSVLGFDRELVDVGDEPSSASPPPVPGDADATQPRDADPFAEPFDEEPTNVREAPAPDAGVDSDAVEAELLDLDEEPWKRAFGRLRDRGALDGEYIVAFVPDGRAMTIQLGVPFLERNKTESVLPHLMVDRLPIDQSQLVWDFQTYPPLEGRGTEEETGGRAFIGFSKNDDIQTTISDMHEVGIDPVVLGIPELFLATVGVRSVGSVGDEPIAFVDIGHELTRVVVVQGTDPLLARTIRSGGRQVTDALAEAFDVSFAEAEKIKHQYAAIVDEPKSTNEQMRVLSKTIREALTPVVRDLRRSFQGLYAKEKLEISRVFVCGGTAQIKNVEGFLTAELGLPVRRMGLPPVGLDANRAPSAHLALAAAISYQAEGVRARTINLRRGRFAYRGKSSYLRRQLAIFAAAVLGLVVVLGGTLYSQKQSYEAQRDAMKSALSKQTKSLFGAELMSKDQIQKAMAGDDAAANAFIPKMSAYQLLHEISTKVSTDITIALDRIEVDADRNLIQIYGETTDAPAVDRIVSDLKTIECFKEVKPDKVKVRDDKADFEIQISSGCS